MKFQVEFVELENGKKPFEDFIRSLTTIERARIFEAIDYFGYLKNNNIPVKESLSKHVDDGIFELRISLSNKIARTLYFYVKGARIVITHGFIKKTKKTPVRELERAKELRNLFLLEMKNDEL